MYRHLNNDKLAAEYKAGASLTQLGLKYGVHFGVIRYRFIKAGVKRRPKGRHVTAKSLALSARMVKLSKRGWSIRRIASKFGLDPASVFRRIHNQPGLSR